MSSREPALRTSAVVVGPIRTNCYLAWCETTRDAVIIDPGAEPERIAQAVEEESLTVRMIINTHGHWDHVDANTEMKRRFGVPIAIGAPDGAMLGGERPDRLLHDHDQVAVGPLNLEVIATPGHTPGGICLYHTGTLFSGDTLFLEDVGRTDLPGGSEETLLRGIRERLLMLPDDTKVYPGHDEPTTIGHERLNNPYLK